MPNNSIVSDTNVSEALLWIWFSQLKVSALKKDLLLNAFSSVEELYDASDLEYAAAGIDDEKHLRALGDKSLSAAESIWMKCKQAGIGVVTMQDDLYPFRLRNIAGMPPVLYYKGVFPRFDEEAAIAVVGSRSHTVYGGMAAERLSYEIAQGGGYVISGLAKGIDAAAHRDALKAGKPTAAVLGCGPDIIYPKENAALYREICVRGCVLSEYAPGTPPLAFHFPERNRIVSGLSAGVLIVEAGKRSGALITANLAGDQGRDVFAVPGNIDVPESEGTNALIKTGAKLVTNGWDVLSEYTSLYPNRIEEGIKGTPYAYVGFEPDIKKSGKDSTKDFTDTQLKIIVSIAKKPLHIDEIIETCGLTASEALSELTLLEIGGAVTQLPGKRFSAV